MEFNLGDKVLVRRSWIKDSAWVPAFFAYRLKEQDVPYVVFGGSRYSDCIPLEGNEKLMGVIPDSEPKRSLKHFEFLEEVEVNVLNELDDEECWSKAWYIECSPYGPSDDSPHKILFSEDNELYYVGDDAIRFKKQV